MPGFRRKGASRRADIPAEILSALNEGRDETVTLVEWLAIDMATLVGHVAPQVGMEEQTAALVNCAAELADHGITTRMRQMGRAFHDAVHNLEQRDAVYLALATHTSDMARAWAAYSLTADTDLPLGNRLDQAMRFAADRAASVRECAWDSFRPYIATDLSVALPLLQCWVTHADPNVRRCAVEGTRPMGVWTSHIVELKANPSPALVLLEPVRSDTSRYVQTAVGNWLNDASKSTPEWTTAVAQRWLADSPTPETQWIVNRGLRTLRKKGIDLAFLA